MAEVAVSTEAAGKMPSAFDRLLLHGRVAVLPLELHGLPHV